MIHWRRNQRGKHDTLLPGSHLARESKESFAREHFISQDKRQELGKFNWMKQTLSTIAQIYINSLYLNFRLLLLESSMKFSVAEFSALFSAKSEPCIGFMINNDTKIFSKKQDILKHITNTKRFQA